MSVGYDTWYKRENNTIFKIKNVSEKDMRIFKLKIHPGYTVDLMRAYWVSEVDIRQSLLKGILYKKLTEGAIEVIESTIDLTQYDETQKAFLNSFGINFGTQGYIEVLYNGEDVAKSAALNFTGEGVNVYDNDGVTDINISGGGSGEGSLVIPDGGNFPGNYVGNIICEGNSNIVEPTTIMGSVNSIGTITNSGGYYVDIYGDVRADALDWVPIDGTEYQNSLNIYGSLTVANINFPIKKRESEGPIGLRVDGNLNVIGTLNGNGDDTCRGLYVTVYGNAVVRNNINVNGGDATSEFDAGEGGSVYIGGSFMQQFDEGGGSINCAGGNSYFDNMKAGNGGNIQVIGNFTGNISVYGGESNGSDGNSAAGNAGSGGNVFINGSAVVDWIETNGGLCYSDNNDAYSGSGGDISIVGNCKAYYIEAGSGGRVGNTTAPSENAVLVEAGTIYVNGDLICQELYGDGGNNYTNYFCQYGANGSDVYVEGSLISSDGVYVSGGNVNATYSDAYAGSGGDIEAVYIIADTIRSEGGSGYHGGDGGTLDIYKVSGSTYVNLDGGDTEGDANGGDGGYIYLTAGGEFDSITSRGGNCTSTDNLLGFGGGRGGSIQVYTGNLICDYIDVSGGNREGATTAVNDTYSGCDSGSISIDNGDLICNDISMNGGSRTTTYRSGPGGNSGYLNVNGNITAVNYIESIGGNSFGGDGGITTEFIIRGSLYSNAVMLVSGASYIDAGDNIGFTGYANNAQLQGSVNVNEFYFMDGASGTLPSVSPPPTLLLEGNHHFKVLNVSAGRFIKALSTDSNVILTAQAMQEKTTLNNSDDTPTESLSGDLQSSIFKHGVDAWYKISGTSI